MRPMTVSGRYDMTIVSAEGLPGLRMRVRFRDGTEGIVLLSDDPDMDHILASPGGFDEFRIGDFGIVWGDHPEYPDETLHAGSVWMYQQITGLSHIELFPADYAWHVTDVRRLGKYRVWVRFRDGTEGEADLSDLAGKGVFREWDEPGGWETVRADPVVGVLAWGPADRSCQREMSPESLYCRVNGLEPAYLDTEQFADEARQRFRQMASSAA